MKIEKIIRAYSSLEYAMKLRNLTGTKVLSMVRLRNKMKEIIDMCAIREQTILEEYADKDESGLPIMQDGTAKVSDRTKERAGKEKLWELYAEEVEMEHDIIRIAMSELQGNVPLCGEDILNLQGFIEFGGE